MGKFTNENMERFQIKQLVHGKVLCDGYWISFLSNI